ncbi:zinc-finger homeodomain protein 2-like [Lycium ferocissimum]|uniref:zinc-finger homeodomain protein 2-like n=1 Tax=Lycium ferocissimum TaxID=112874 RepID=UPI00281697C9|nr:zinc-finger homeodomain protein 2-like [Lycium ferocissimum]
MDEFSDQEEHNQTQVPPQPTKTPSPPQLEPITAFNTWHNNNKNKPKYKECLKNHAVSIGGHAVDGCCEFLPSGEDGSIDSLKCAACNCHRNFHRKVVISGETTAFVMPSYYRSLPPPPQTAAACGYLQYHVATHQRPLALPSTCGGGGVYHEDQEDMSGGSGSKKRFRTKFSQEQKEKMQEVADKLGWRIQREDEELVQQLCNETGIRRQVFKVWMHNNKHTLGKKTLEPNKE